MLRRALRAVRSTAQRGASRGRVAEAEPHVVFLITPPFSGSTAIANILGTSPRAMFLSPNGEGQWLVPELCAADRWDADKEIDFERVRQTWLDVYRAAIQADPQIDVIIEKSPPNMVRINDLAAQFPDHSFLANNRDPYANCASILYRNHAADDITASERRVILEQQAEDWMMRSDLIRGFVTDHDVPLLTYEQFCAVPSSILDMLELPDGCVDTIDVAAKVTVKDYDTQVISNQNERQTAQLDAAEIDTVSRVLASDTALVNYFGYRIRE